MSALREAFDAVRKLALNAQDEYDAIAVGSLPTKDSLCMALAAGGERNTTLDLKGDMSIDIVLNGKHKDQATLVDVLATIHQKLTTKKDLPAGNGWQVLSISSSSLPTYIEFDGDQYLYGSGLDVQIATL